MFIRLAPALSVAALATCLATPALAAETDAAIPGPVDATANPADGAEDTAAAPLIRAIPPIDYDKAARAEDAEPAFTVSGSATITTDYRFRGVSQSDNGFAVQGGLTVSHTSGAYVGLWASNLAGWGTFGGPNLELDLIGGFKFPVGQGTADVGLVWYMYPGGAATTDFAEIYAKLSGAVGPVSLTAGVAYAPPQEALGNVYPTGARFVAGRPRKPGDTEPNLYLTGDAVYAITDTPVSLKAHIGYSDGNPGLGPNGTSVAPTGTYFDWLLGVDVTPIEHLTFSLAYVDTDISRAQSAYLLPNFAALDGDSIAGATVVFSVTAAF
ncbi:TorF family putative porin [Erythrobacter sp. WG]|uniref:TorF family putative porin n=1 Tax=Erythrobacter sp. WG TaxID=2985510 RepID=UPI00226ECC36|nr:TorF family putative porin [Erythrobacter sp. WG]MCX9147314.1 TorF family putative porin [Erythrobacter sp. WG]